MWKCRHQSKSPILSSWLFAKEDSQRDRFFFILKIYLKFSTTRWNKVNWLFASLAISKLASFYWRCKTKLYMDEKIETVYIFNNGNWRFWGYGSLPKIFNVLSCSRPLKTVVQHEQAQNLSISKANIFQCRKLILFRKACNLIQQIWTFTGCPKKN